MSLPPCKYGAKCFQKNASHLAAYSHPKKDCKYGSKCYDKSISHLSAFDHPKQSVLKKRKAPTSDSDEEDQPQIKQSKKTRNQTIHDSSEDKSDSDEKESTNDSPKIKTSCGQPPCPHGAYCYRKSKAHHQQFSHPPQPSPSNSKIKENSESESDPEDNITTTQNKAKTVFVPTAIGKTNACNESDSEDEGDEEEPSRVKLPPPKNVMKQGDIVKIKSTSSNSVYQIKRTGDDYYCTCMAWKNQNAAPAFRSCKHLREHLGEAFEKARVSVGGCTLELLRPTKKQKISVLLAKPWTPATDPTGWYMSEKLDGVRAYWTGKEMLSRLGNPFPIPKWLRKLLPADKELDGELWTSRGEFQTIVSIVKTFNHRQWNTITYQVFDIPSAKGEFKDRYQTLIEMCEEIDSPHIQSVKHVECKGQTHLEEFMEEVTGDEGEGAMLRKPDSLYHRTRSSTLLKVKTFSDADGKIIGHEPGKGRLKGLCGALVIQMKNGKEFRVGTGLSDQQRRKPLAIGKIITYKYQGLTNDGIPRFPVFVGERIDKEKPSDPK